MIKAVRINIIIRIIQTENLVIQPNYSIVKITVPFQEFDFDYDKCFTPHLTIFQSYGGSQFLMLEREPG